MAGALLAAVLPLAACSGAGTEQPTATSPGAPMTSSTTDSTTTSAPTAADSAYCEALRAGKADLEKISANLTDATAAQEGLDALERIAAEAPAQLEPAWDDLMGLVEALGSGDAAAVSTAAAKAQQAVTSIKGHAETECGVTLS